jgi:hypothetical protein
MGYRSTRIQVLLLGANDLGFGAETPKENLRNDELRTARTGSNFGAAGHLPFLSCQRFPLRVARCPSSTVGASMIGIVSGSFRSIV